VVEVAIHGGIGDADALVDVGQRALALVGREGAELSVLLCDDAFIQPLNAQWRGQDVPTDVLSFPQGACPGPDLLGDVVISVETAERQALEQEHTLQVELEVLLIHGLCHLLGYDHVEPGDAENMRIEEDRLLAALGVTTGSGLVTRAIRG
jgi:probable rRNA maturation factor